MKMTPPRHIKETFEIPVYEVLENTLGNIKLNVDSLIEKHGEDAWIDFDIDSTLYAGSTTLTITLKTTRPETPEEIEKRIAQTRKDRAAKKDAKAKKEERERQLYLRLHEKFGQRKED